MPSSGPNTYHDHIVVHLYVQQYEREKKGDILRDIGRYIYGQIGCMKSIPKIQMGFPSGFSLKQVRY